MKRRERRKLLREIAAEFGAKPYSWWKEQTLPITEERKAGNEAINVDCQVLSDTEEYLQVGVSVDDGGFISTHFSCGISIIIDKPWRAQCRRRPGGALPACSGLLRDRMSHTQKRRWVLACVGLVAAYWLGMSLVAIRTFGPGHDFISYLPNGYSLERNGTIFIRAPSFVPGYAAGELPHLTGQIVTKQSICGIQERGGVVYGAGVAGLAVDQVGDLAFFVLDTKTGEFVGQRDRSKWEALLAEKYEIHVKDSTADLVPPFDFYLQRQDQSVKNAEEAAAILGHLLNSVEPGYGDDLTLPVTTEKGHMEVGPGAGRP